MKYSPENQQFTIAFNKEVRKGEAFFYRKKGKELVFRRTLLAGSLFNFETNLMAKGSWDIQFYWSDGRNDYFKEVHLVIK